jgi:hypothetical protein
MPAKAGFVKACPVGIEPTLRVLEALVLPLYEGHKSCLGVTPFVFQNVSRRRVSRVSHIHQTQRATGAKLSVRGGFTHRFRLSLHPLSALLPWLLCVPNQLLSPISRSRTSSPDRSRTYVPEIQSLSGQPHGPRGNAPCYC